MGINYLMKPESSIIIYLAVTCLLPVAWLACLPVGPLFT